MENLDYNRLDSHNFIPSPSILGNVLTHTGNQNQYSITGFVWLGATDEWGFKAIQMNHYEHPIEIVRPLSHLCGERSNGEMRYQEGGDYTDYLIS